MLVQILDKLKNKGFWAGGATSFGGFLAVTLSAPVAIFNILTQLIGG